MKFYNIFYILLLKQNIRKKRQVNDNQLQFVFEFGNNKKYEVKNIHDMVYAMEFISK